MSGAGCSLFDLRVTSKTISQCFAYPSCVVRRNGSEFVGNAPFSRLWLIKWRISPSRETAAYREPNLCGSGSGVNTNSKSKTLVEKSTETPTFRKSKKGSIGTWSIVLVPFVQTCFQTCLMTRSSEEYCWKRTDSSHSNRLQHRSKRALSRPSLRSAGTRGWQFSEIWGEAVT